jgi:hypothetical protein
MADENSKSLDIFGIKPVSDAISHVTKASIDGASAFLGRVCLPVAEEFGLLLQDKVRAWRSNNALNIVNAAQNQYKKYQRIPTAHAHPRLVAAAIENGSWTDDKVIQEMWGGLLASSCTADGRDESNLIFINILSQLTSLQVRVLNYVCEKAEKEVIKSGVIFAKGVFYVKITDLKEIAGTHDIHRLDQELDYLRSLELIQEGISYHNPDTANVTPSSLALNLYVRCQGFNGSAIEFFRLS